jgi:hypothetical protein
MAMVNSKSIRNAIKQFVKDNGKEPTVKEAKDMISGNNKKKERK